MKKILIFLIFVVGMYPSCLFCSFNQTNHPYSCYSLVPNNTERLFNSVNNQINDCYLGQNNVSFNEKDYYKDIISSLLRLRKDLPTTPEGFIQPKENKIGEEKFLSSLKVNQRNFGKTFIRKNNRKMNLKRNGKKYKRPTGICGYCGKTYTKNYLPKHELICEETQILKLDATLRREALKKFFDN